MVPLAIGHRAQLPYCRQNAVQSGQDVTHSNAGCRVVERFTPQSITPDVVPNTEDCGPRTTVLG